MAGVSARPGRVIWITGLSGAGKTTLAKALLPLLPEPRLLLDGDVMREALAPLAGGYDPESRKRLAGVYSRLCKLAAEQGVTVVCATISMFHEVRDWNRANLPGYVEVYLETSEELRLARDVKNVYGGGKHPPACAGENGAAGASPVAGRDYEPELPLCPDIVISRHDQEPCVIAAEILRCLAALSRSL